MIVSAGIGIIAASLVPTSQVPSRVVTESDVAEQLELIAFADSSPVGVAELFLASIDDGLSAEEQQDAN